MLRSDFDTMVRILKMVAKPTAFYGGGVREGKTGDGNHPEGLDQKMPGCTVVRPEQHAAKSSWNPRDSRGSRRK